MLPWSCKIAPAGEVTELAESTGLENRRRFIPTVGSNPTLSAIQTKKPPLWAVFWFVERVGFEPTVIRLVRQAAGSSLGGGLDHRHSSIYARERRNEVRRPRRGEKRSDE